MHYMSAYDFLLFSSHDLVKVCYVMRQGLESLRVPLTVWEDFHCLQRRTKEQTSGQFSSKVQ